MSKKTTFTTISPLPAGIPREVVIEFLHNHQEMIDLNPLIVERHPIPPPDHASAEEARCVWWSMTDKISYLPGGLASGEVEYTAAFNDLPNGIQTHVYAPLGLDIRERWSLGGTLPGEPLEPVEIGLGAPRQGLYLREDVELRCNFVMASFVKKTLKKAHGTLVERLCFKATMTGPKEPSPGTSISGSINSHTSNDMGDRRTSMGARPTNNRQSSQYSGEHNYSRYSQQPPPRSYSNSPNPPRFVPYRKPVPLPQQASSTTTTNGWSEKHAHAPAELQ
ncbi:hypothetical protein F4808DRAFT_311010 [Astrocystis sublimbata]|nr:hypothetical protein F4808DRAFT_311010 [Astrocystis sublimbata]